MAPKSEAVLEAACKSGIDILDELLCTNIEESSRFEGKALSPSFLVGFSLSCAPVNLADTKDPRSCAAETTFPVEKKDTTMDFYLHSALHS